MLDLALAAAGQLGDLPALPIEFGLRGFAIVRGERLIDDQRFDGEVKPVVARYGRDLGGAPFDEFDIR